MRYMSDDGKVFNTEQECYEYEEQVKEKTADKERLEAERQKKLNEINKKYKELQELISGYEKKYSVRQSPYFAPIYELMNMLCI